MFASYLDTITPGLFLIAFLAVLHASFQIATSVLTLLSGHSFIRSKAHHRLTLLNLSYSLGVFLTTGLLIASTTSAFTLWLPYELVNPLWLGIVGASVTVGFLVILFYYRAGKGTQLWIPRSFAVYLESRAKRTKNVIEASALGVISVIAELPFTTVLIVTSSLVLASTVVIDDYLAIIGLYAFVVTLPLLLLTALLASGHKLSRIQRWRESNKQFLQLASGIGLLIVAIFVWINYILLGASS